MSNNRTDFIARLTSLFSATPPAQVEPEVKIKKHRKTSHFSTNKVASLELPNEIYKKVEKKSEESSYSVDNAIRYISSFFYPPTNNDKKEEPKRLQIKKTMELLEAQVKQIKKRCDNEIEQETSKPNDLTGKAKIKYNEKLTEKIEKKYKLEIDNFYVEKVRLVEDLIKEHAARRVDLFFYLLLSVYNKQVVVTKASTNKQHGRGDKEELGTAACHSSLFPNVKLVAIPSNSFFWTTPIAQDLQSTHLHDSLNMTVELPTVVNDFDGQLEGRYSKTPYTLDCLAILNKTAKGELTPPAAMQQFFQVMNRFFNIYERDYILTGKNDYPQAKKLIWQYQKQGTFIAANPDLSIKNEYLHAMLRIKQQTMLEKAQEMVYSSLPTYYRNIQEEIYPHPTLSR